MKVESKYKIYDHLWFMDENKAKNSRVQSIELTNPVSDSSFGYEPKIVYHLSYYGTDYTIAEHKLYPSKEELLKSL